MLVLVLDDILADVDGQVLPVEVSGCECAYFSAAKGAECGQHDGDLELVPRSHVAPGIFVGGVADVADQAVDFLVTGDMSHKFTRRWECHIDRRHAGEFEC